MFCTYFALFSVFLYTLHNTFSIGWPTFLWRFHFSFTVCFHRRGHTYIVCEMWNESSSGWPCMCTHTDSRAVAAADGLIILVVMGVLTRVKASFCSLGGRETLYFREPPVCESTEEAIIGSLEKAALAVCWSVAPFNPYIWKENVDDKSGVWDLWCQQSSTSTRAVKRTHAHNKTILKDVFLIYQQD